MESGYIGLSNTSLDIRIHKGGIQLKGEKCIRGDKTYIGEECIRVGEGCICEGRNIRERGRMYPRGRQGRISKKGVMYPREHF